MGRTLYFMGSPVASHSCTVGILMRKHYSTAMLIVPPVVDSAEKKIFYSFVNTKFRIFGDGNLLRKTIHCNKKIKSSRETISFHKF